MPCRLASSFHQRLNSSLSQPARATSAEIFVGPRGIANEKSLLHLSDSLARNVEFGRHPVDTVRVQPYDRLGNDGSGVQLVRNRDPVVAAKAPFREPATDFAPKRR